MTRKRSQFASSVSHSSSLSQCGKSQGFILSVLSFSLSLSSNVFRFVAMSTCRMDLRPFQGLGPLGRPRGAYCCSVLAGHARGRVGMAK